MKTLLLFALGALLSFGARAEKSSQKYRITFHSNWNSSDHLSVPGSAHFSPLVAVTHNGNYELLPLGGMASSGLEGVAELGRTGGIHSEIRREKKRGNVGERHTTQNLFVREKRTQTFEVTASKRAPFLSFVTMIAPSPDWVVGLSGFSLYSEDQGFFKGTSEELPLFAINAGTEEGDFGGNYRLNNPASRPQQVIDYLMGRGFEAPFAMVTIQPIQ